MSATCESDPEVIVAGSCSVCRNGADNRVHTAREMMFGTREQFHYLECARCGSLELLDVPADLSPYYPSDYYSFTSGRPPLTELRRGRLHSVRRLRARIALRSGRFARIAYGEDAPPWLQWLQGLSLPDSILDVGCGGGGALADMWHEGFSCLTGCDAYLNEPFDNGELRLVKADPADMRGSFDVVMAHHSFEHMPDPHRTMEQLRRLAQGRIVLTVPVPGFGWREYGVNWFALDAPRHLHILTPEAMDRLADEHGLRVAHMYYEPLSLSLWASEQYAADIPFLDSRSYNENPDALSPERVADYERRARELSAAGDGDVAVFFLEHV